MKTISLTPPKRFKGAATRWRGDRIGCVPRPWVVVGNVRERRTFVRFKGWRWVRVWVVS